MTAADSVAADIHRPTLPDPERPAGIVIPHVERPLLGPEHERRTRNAATGRSVEDLEKEPLVVQGCTFARMAELAGAKYLHSYFFYDQSFMVMQAAWLLDIPRGVSCYADHMMDDYPFKLVPLQVELSDVIVATSARIKRELSGKTGGRFDHQSGPKLTPGAIRMEWER